MRFPYLFPKRFPENALGTPYDGTEGMVLQVHLRSAGSMLRYAREELVRVHRVALTLRESA